MSKNIEWKKTTLSNLVTEKDGIKRGPWGGSIKKSFFVNEGYKIYEQKNVIENNFLIGNYYISEDKYKELQSFEIHEGDILVTGAGTIGKIAVVPKEFKKGIINQALLRIRLDEKKVYKKFFIYLLKFFSVVLNQTYIKGSGLKNLSSINIIKNFPITIPFKNGYPDIGEQKRIADEIELLFLEIDKGILFTSKSIEDLKKILWTEVDNLIIRNLNNDWEYFELGCIANKITDGTHKTPKYITNGVPFITTINVVPFHDYFDFDSYIKFISEEEHKELLKRTNPEKGDLLLSKCGTIGRTQVIRVDYEFSIFVGLMLIKLKKDLIYPKFLEYFFNHPAIKMILEDISTGATRATLPISVLKKFKIPLPLKENKPDIKQQKSIVKKLDDISLEVNKLHKKLKEQLQNFELLKQSILTEAFQGKL